MCVCVICAAGLIHLEILNGCHNAVYNWINYSPQNTMSLHSSSLPTAKGGLKLQVRPLYLERGVTVVLNSQ